MGEDLSELGPGLHVYTAVAALEHAGRLAAELRADLCVTAPQVEEVLAERRSLPPLHPTDLAELRALADRVAAADRIVGETRRRAALDVAERLAETGAGMAIHPSTIRDRANALVQARLELAQAEQLLAAQEEMAAAAPDVEAAPPTPALTPLPSDDAPTPPPRRRGFLARFRRANAEDPEDTSASSDILRQMSAATDEAFGARRAAVVRDDQRALLAARRTSADERVRVATRAWRELAGDDVEPDDVEAVIRRYDPQHQEALIVADDTVHVRTVSRLQRASVDRWNEAWASRGLDAPPPPVAVTVVEELGHKLARPVVVVGEAVDEARMLAEALPVTPVVAVEEAAVASPDANVPEPEGSGTEAQDDVVG